MKSQRIAPTPGQESVWEYPRPPRVEPTPRHIQVVFNGVTLADTRRALRVLETSHPPVYYISPQDIRTEFLIPATLQTFCEFKGGAHHYSIAIGDKHTAEAAWYYPAPAPGYEELKDYVAFYPGKMDACFVDGERVTPQPGDFYGGWITHEISGPFKGGPGSWGW
jgi:uncharacterized protein (DUF427 family)